MTDRIAVSLLAAALSLVPYISIASEDNSTRLPLINANDYARAERWTISFSQDRIPGVKNLLVIPRWVGDDEFWYLREAPGSQEFVLVDAATGTKQPAFDHRAIATALADSDIAQADAGSLPFSSFEYADERSAIIFTIVNQLVRCGLIKPGCSAESVADVEPGFLVSPDGGLAVYSEAGDLYLKDLSSGEQSQLTTDGEPHNGYGIYYGNWQASFVARKRSGERQVPMETSWSPDSQKVLVTHLDDRHVAEYPLIETAPGDGSFRPKVHLPRIPLMGERPPELEWHVIDVSTGKKVRLDLPYKKLFHVHQDMLAIRNIWWSEDTSQLYAVAWGDNLEAAYLFDIDLQTGAVRTVIEERIAPRTDTNSTSYNPPNVQVVNNGEEIIWFSMRDGWGHLYLYDGRTGKLKNRITRGDWLVRELVKVDRDEHLVYFTAGGREPGNPYYRYLYRVNFDGSGLLLLSPEEGDHLITSPWNDVLSFDGAIGYDVVSPSGEYAVYNYSRPDLPTRSVIRRTGDGSEVSVFETADTDALYDAGWRNPEEVIVKAADGKTDLYGLIYKPANLDPGKKYPIIDSQYASPLTAVVPRNFSQVLRAIPGKVAQASLAELGFVVVVIDARGTTYRSREFSHHSWGNLNTIGLEDHVAAIKQLAEKHAWMDIDRVGVHGSSYGGWTAFRAMFEFPEFYKVGISNVGMGSLHNMYPDYHWTAFHGKPKYGDDSRFMGAPDEKPANFLDVDGTLQAENLAGPLLIMLGELDENVLPGTTLQVVAKLIELDKDFDMLYLPNENHYYFNAHIIRRMWNFFVEHLHGQTPPDYKITSKD